ncbi:MAG: hypothetical protein FWD89_03810 [Firmicutes bacterium]|nr:hypothetical protein [Bacillota bacterium]
MKKFSKLIFMFFVLPFFFLTACSFVTELDPEGGGGSGGGGGDGGGSEVCCDKDDHTMCELLKFGPNMLQGFSIIIDADFQSLAVESRTGQTPATNNRNFLVAFDSENDLNQVEFMYEGNVITQEEILATVSGLFITTEFTYIMFSPLGQTVSQSSFTANGWFGNNQWDRTFVIDNETKKLHSTTGIGTFTRIRENFVSINNRFHKLTIDNEGKLKATRIIANDNISEFDVMIDIYGNVFVLNNMVNEIRDNFFFYTSSFAQLFMGSDGRVYTHNNTFSTLIQNGLTIRSFDSSLTLINVPANRTALFGEYLIKNNMLYFIWNQSNPTTMHVATLTNGVASGVSNRTGSTFRFVGHEIFADRLVEGTRNLFHFNMSTNLLNTTAITTFTSMRISRETIILTRETLDGTQEFAVFVKEGEVQFVPLADIEDTQRLLTIQPIK